MMNNSRDVPNFELDLDSQIKSFVSHWDEIRISTWQPKLTI